MTLGENLQHLRKEKGLSQEEVAKALFVSRQTISKWETNKAEPGVEDLKALADLYGVTLGQLAGHGQWEGVSPEPKRTNPEETFRLRAFLRLAVWGAVVAASGLLGDGKSEILQGIAWAGTIGSASLCLSVRVRNRYVWGSLLCGEFLCLVVAVACVIWPQDFLDGVASVGTAAVLCLWLHQLSSEPVRRLFEKE